MDSTSHGVDGGAPPEQTFIIYNMFDLFEVVEIYFVNEIDNITDNTLQSSSISLCTMVEENMRKNIVQ
jgi:hypothetical protein